jgi:hypothetical protein
VQVTGGVQLRSATDGTLLATASGASGNWRLASDGSYLCSATTSGLSAWSLNGAPVLQRAGDYSQAYLYCAPTEMRVAAGPAGAHQVETVGVPGGADAVGPVFSGGFATWFEDGERFLSTLGVDTVWVYSKDGSVQLDARVLGRFDGTAGEGNWFWTWYPLKIYAVGASATPAVTVETYGPVLWADATIAARSALTEGLLHLVDLSGASPVVTDYTSVPVPTAFAATSSTQWMLGASPGLLIDGTSLASTPRYFGFGAPLSIAGSSTRLAVATATNRTLIYDATSWTLEGTLQSPITSLAMSADGGVLGTLGFDGTDYFVRTYTLPAVSLLHGWTYPSSAPPVYLTLSADGTTLAQVLQSGSQGELDNAATGAVLWSAPVPGAPIRLSPDGTSWTTSGARDSTGTTTLFHNGTQVSLVQGWAQAWLTNDRLLLLEFGSLHTNNAVYLDARLYDSSGASLGVVPLPAAFALPFVQYYPDVQVLGADSLYQPGSNSIWTVSTGTQSWVGPVPSPYVQAGAVAGSDVVFLQNSQLLIQPH